MEQVGKVLSQKDSAMIQLLHRSALSAAVCLVYEFPRITIGAYQEVEKALAQEGISHYAVRAAALRRAVQDTPINALADRKLNDMLYIGFMRRILAQSSIRRGLNNCWKDVLLKIS